ncbi:MAG: 2-C-methyl-D-erythritol 2,4-cyclodiphosphate synthase [Simkaniaceae bacterium]|nr:2-C-methyl-D-erythritol 2,4-cyclodiphosphate synthase [Simkaniaceae bacterium]MCF7852284.1 2-C-methyl-D-erythritol 2,4-cyclodiphosphate synthase [Simkaniaceae bacterium]
MFRTGLGQDSHRFLKEKSHKKCVIGGLVFEEVNGLDADSDGDVVLHSICNAISSITHVYILGEIAPKLCKEQGVTDSRVYLQEALKTLGSQKISHVSLALEAKQPRLQKHLDAIRSNVANLMGLNVSDVGMTVTSGDQLTDFARGEGIQCLAIVTVEQSPG